jgi:hypothetical protein
MHFTFRTKYARVGLCVPRDSTTRVKFLGNDAKGKWNKWSQWKKGNALTSIEDLDSSTNPTDYFVDSDVG